MNKGNFPYSHAQRNRCSVAKIDSAGSFYLQQAQYRSISLSLRYCLIRWGGRLLVEYKQLLRLSRVVRLAIGMTLPPVGELYKSYETKNTTL